MRPFLNDAILIKTDHYLIASAKSLSTSLTIKSTFLIFSGKCLLND